MYIEGENEEVDTTTDAASAATEVEDTKPGSEEDLRDKALAAFDEGVEEESATPKAKEEKAEEAEEVEGEEEKPETDEEKAEREAAEHKAADEAEAAALNLKDKARDRFHELTTTARELTAKFDSIGGDETIARLAEIGGKEGFERVIQDAADQQQWDAKITEIGCTPEQFGQAMGFVAAINSDDEPTLRQARDNLLKEVALLDGRLGEKTDRHDPLAAHPDLVARVQAGGIDEEDALELVRLRAQAAKGQQVSSATTAAQQAEHARNEATGQLGQLGQLGSELSKRDGKEVFDAKMDAIRDALDSALPELPPSRWAAYAHKLYEGVKLPKPPQQPRVGKQPVRQSHVTQGATSVRPDVPKSKFGAFDQAVEEAREAGL